MIFASGTQFPVYWPLVQAIKVNNTNAPRGLLREGSFEALL